MEFPRMAYKMIEDVVGSENISDDPAILAAYYREGAAFPTEKPAAVVMPRNTEEVAATIKICNRFGIKYSCFVTMSPMCTEPGMLLFDLKKMNRIIEINEKDMYAIVEPGVTRAALAIECFKRGLHYPVASVVGSALVGAVTKGIEGHGYMANRFSDGRRHAMAVEWVTPTGDIVRLGSLGAGTGWFCGTGPGPGLDGLITRSGLGIITKIAIRLYPWWGPRELEVERLINPRTGAFAYHTKLPEDKFKLLLFQMPGIDELGWEESLRNLGEALYEISKAEVGTAVFKLFNWPIIIEGCSTVEEAWEKIVSGYYQRETSRVIVVFIEACCREDLEYQEKVVREIMAEYGGKEAPREFYDEGWLVGKALQLDLATTSILLGISSCRVQKFGGFETSACGVDSIDTMVKWGMAIPEIRREYVEKGLIADTLDSYWIVPTEYGHMAVTENLILGDPTDPDSLEAMRAYANKVKERNMSERFPDVMFRFFMYGNEDVKRLGPLYSNFHIWQMRIKKALDPNLVANPKFYVMPEEG
ncbi:MAG: FAD-binding oxidoreductase [Candidatus Bathyarchaeia archaeon]